MSKKINGVHTMKEYTILFDDWSHVDEMVYIIKTVNIDKLTLDVYNTRRGTVESGLSRESKSLRLSELAGTVTLKASKHVITETSLSIGRMISDIRISQTEKTATIYKIHPVDVIGERIIN